MLSFLASTLLLSNVSPIQTLESKVERDAAAATVTYTLPNLGSIVLYLPSDMRAGDSITGTVLAIPTGKSDAEKAKNTATLEGYVVALPGGTTPARVSQPKFTIPAAIAGTLLAIPLLDSKGKPAGQVTVPIGPSCDNPWTSLEIPRVGSAGSPIEINGPFDGNLGNTSASFNGQPMPVLAESPRGCITLPPPGHVGKGEISCKEGGMSESAPYNNLKLSMAAGKTNLLAGEKTQISVAVSGLDGMSADDFPVPLEITNGTPAIVQIDGFARNTECFAIHHAAVVGNVWNMSLTAAGIIPGRFFVRGVLFAVSIHDLKKNLDKAGFKALMNGLIAKYEAEIAQINAEEKAAKDAGNKWPGSPAETGRKMRRGILQALVEKLKLARDLANNDLDSAKLIADKAMSEITAIEMASELVTFAADLLGYTDIPVPGVGAILKGLKVLTKAEKVIKLIEAAEAALELYEKAKDVADKAEKLKDLKDKVDKVKEALKSDE